MSNAPDETSRRLGRSPLGAIGLLSLLYLLSRVASLDVLPVFLDEAVHIQWAERLYGEGRILKPVGSGRLLAVAAYGAALPFEDRLFAARLVAVCAGALTLLATTLLASRIFGARAGLIAGLLYVLSPFALVYDRLALSDGFLSAAIACLMLATWAVVHEPGHRPGHSHGAGFPMMVLFVALAVVSKVSAVLYLPAVPLAVLTLSKAKVKDRRSGLRSIALALSAGLVLASPMLWFFALNSGEISSQHVVDPARVSSVVLSTLSDMGQWVVSYFTPPVLMAATLSFFLLRDGRALWLLVSVLLPFLLFAFLSQPWSARYVLPTLPPLLILTAGGVDAVATRLKTGSAWAALGLALGICVPALLFDRDLLLDPTRAPFPADDRLQFVTDWPSGYGVRELTLRLKREALSGPITVYVDSGGLRTLPTSLAVLAGREASISLVEGDFASAEFRAAATAGAQGRTAFAIFGPRSPSFDFSSEWKEAVPERIEVYTRPGGSWAATLFRLRGRVAGRLGS